MKYFDGISSKEDLKKRFKELSKKLHPDKGGNENDFKLMLAEYQEILEKGFTSFQGAEGAEDLTETLKDVLKSVLRLAGIEVDLIGSWIWVEGNTYPHKAVLKTWGFRWSKQRKKWYFHEGDFKKGKKNKASFEDIKQKYGSTNFKSNIKGCFIAG